uniref:hypothetical protein n=1 Tax=Chloroflexus sp. TaxID=1904827 RepID=UPI002ACD8C00
EGLGVRASSPRSGLRTPSPALQGRGPDQMVCPLLIPLLQEIASPPVAARNDIRIYHHEVGYADL